MAVSIWGKKPGSKKGWAGVVKASKTRVRALWVSQRKEELAAVV